MVGENLAAVSPELSTTRGASHAQATSKINSDKAPSGVGF